MMIIPAKKADPERVCRIFNRCPLGVSTGVPEKATHGFLHLGVCAK
jgi:hypothetical protein